MSGIVKHRRPWRRFAAATAVLAVAIALTGTLAAALQIRHLRIEGPTRFPVRDVEEVLAPILGSTTLANRAAELRARVSEIPWVAEASVRVSLDGTVNCLVREKQPVAVARDGPHVCVLDQEGNVLGEARGELPALELRGFAPFPAERAVVLAAVEKFERAWGAPVKRIERLGSADVSLVFADVPCTVLVDPLQPEHVAVARRVLEAWQRDGQPMPLRLDARVVNRVAVLPAPAPAEAGP